MEHGLQATTYTYGNNAKLGGYKNFTFRPSVKKLAELCKVKFLLKKTLLILSETLNGITPQNNNAVNTKI